MEVREADIYGAFGGNLLSRFDKLKSSIKLCRTSVNGCMDVKSRLRSPHIIIFLYCTSLISFVIQARHSRYSFSQSSADMQGKYTFMNNVDQALP